MRKVAALMATWVALLGLGQARAQDRWDPQDPLPAVEETVTGEQAKVEEGAFPLGASVSFGQSLGAGTFIADKYLRRASYDVSLRFSPYWNITRLLSLSAGIGVSASLVENYDSSMTYERRWILSDTSLSLRHANLVTIPWLDVGVNGSLSFTFPTSPQSHYRQLYFSGRANVGLSKSFGDFYMGYSLGFYKNFNRYTSPAINTDEVGDHIILAHFEGAEQLTNDLIATGGSNTSFGVLNSLSIGYSWPDLFVPGQTLSVGMNYSINHSWTYESWPKDDLSSEYAVAGRGHRDSHGGGVDVGYQINKYLGVSVGVDTMVAPKTDDNKAFVFPLLNFSNNYRNNTSFSATVTGTF